MQLFLTNKRQDSSEEEESVEEVSEANEPDPRQTVQPEEQQPLDMQPKEEQAAENDNPDAEEDESSDEPVHPMLAMFTREIHWTPHPFDINSEEGTAAVSYESICPVGGPGGLICCEVCAATYSKYMSGTYKDIQEQKTSKLAGELKQLVEFTGNAKKQLKQTVRAARKKPPPVMRKRDK